MVEQRISIGEMSRLNGISVRMLRFYHEKDLLVPAIVDEQTGYRYYTLEQCSTLDAIQQLQALEIPLKQIKLLLDAENPAYVKELIEERKSSIESQISNLNTQYAVCSALLENYAILENQPICNQIMLENLPERTVVRFPHEQGDVYAHIVDSQMADDELEMHLRFIKQEFIERGYPLSLFRNIGCIIPAHHLADRNISFDWSYAFICDAEAIAPQDRFVIPAGQHVTMYIEGTHDEEGSYCISQAINSMLDYIDENAMEISGDYFDEVIADTPPLSDKRWKTLIKMSIPVRKAGSS